jgi:DNA-binding transcriptional regulator/RsmH inhibitor MraZ
MAVIGFSTSSKNNQENNMNNVSYKTNTEMLTRCAAPQGMAAGLYGANIYDVDNKDQIMIVATTRNGTELEKTVTVISANEYAEIADQHDDFNKFAYHKAVMSTMGFSTLS